MRLYVLRHAQRAPDDPTFDSPLLPEGQETATELATKLKTSCPPFTHLYTSPFLRCVQTIAPYCQASERVVRVEHALYEYIRADAGHDPVAFRRSWEQGTHPELDACVDRTYASWWPLTALTYDESETTMRRRVRAFVAHLREQHAADDVVLLVTHLSAINAILDRPDETDCAMGSVVEVEV